jgi:alpha-ketoglutarate-dependent 2,4-dichlorophenoxyacetate dioxygenase
MPHATVPEYQHIQVTELGPTFGAEVSGIDFSKPVEPEVFKEILDAQVKVCSILSTVLRPCALAPCPRCPVSV